MSHFDRHSPRNGQENESATSLKSAYSRDLEPKPIACTLSAADLKERGRAWQKLLGSGLVERSRVPGGIVLRAEPGATLALMQLVDLERECCTWIDFELLDQSTVQLTAGGDGQRVLAEMFLPADY